jgi:opacity protein-like surface antigen
MDKRLRAVTVMLAMISMLAFSSPVFAQAKGTFPGKSSSDSEAGPSDNQPAPESEKPRGKGMVSANNFMPFFALSAGYGTSYGGLGGNFEIQGIPILALTVGGGSTDGIGMILGGLRFNFPIGEHFLLRASLLGGQVAVAEIEQKEGDWWSAKTSTKKEARTGFAAGVGAVFFFTHNFFLATDVYYVNAGRVEDQDVNGVTFNAGLGFLMDLPKTKHKEKSAPN